MTSNADHILPVERRSARRPFRRALGKVVAPAFWIAAGGSAFVGIVNHYTPLVIGAGALAVVGTTIEAIRLRRAAHGGTPQTFAMPMPTLPMVPANAVPQRTPRDAAEPAAAPRSGGPSAGLPTTGQNRLSPPSQALGALVNPEVAVTAAASMPTHPVTAAATSVTMSGAGAVVHPAVVNRQRSQKRWRTPASVRPPIAPPTTMSNAIVPAAQRPQTVSVISVRTGHVVTPAHDMRGVLQSATDTAQLSLPALPRAGAVGTAEPVTALPPLPLERPDGNSLVSIDGPPIQAQPLVAGQPSVSAHAGANGEPDGLVGGAVPMTRRERHGRRSQVETVFSVAPQRPREADPKTALGSRVIAEGAPVAGPSTLTDLHQRVAQIASTLQRYDVHDPVVEDAMASAATFTNRSGQSDPDAPMTRRQRHGRRALRHDPSVEMPTDAVTQTQSAAAERHS